MNDRDQLQRIKIALATLRAAPDPQTLTDKIPPLAESLLLGAITESEFKASLQEIDWQRTRTAALNLAKNSIFTQQRDLEEAISRQELAAQREQALTAAKAIEANRSPKPVHNYGPRATGGSDRHERH